MAYKQVLRAIGALNVRTRNSQMRNARRTAVIAVLSALTLGWTSPTTAASVSRAFEAASVDVTGNATCTLHPAGNTDPKQAIPVGVSADGVARFLALRPTRKGDVTKMTLDCSDALGNSHVYPVDLTSQTTFASRTFDPVKAQLASRPALKGDPLSYSIADLIDRGYGLRPDPKSNPTGYARWLKAASLPTNLLQRSGAASASRPFPAIDDRIQMRLPVKPQGVNAGVTVGSSALCSGNPPGCYWTGAILHGSYSPSSDPTKGTYYVANEGLFTLPQITVNGGGYSGKSDMSIWTGLDNVFQAVTFVYSTGTVAGADVVTQFHYKVRSGNPATANGASGITFTPLLGDTIFAEEWYCDANGNPNLSAGYACTFMQDLNPKNNQAWVCDKANSSSCASTWMASGLVLGTQAEYIVENDSPQYGATYYWPDFQSSPIEMYGSPGGYGGQHHRKPAGWPLGVGGDRSGRAAVERYTAAQPALEFDATRRRGADQYRRHLGRGWRTLDLSGPAAAAAGGGSGHLPIGLSDVHRRGRSALVPSRQRLPEAAKADAVGATQRGAAGLNALHRGAMGGHHRPQRTAARCAGPYAGLRSQALRPLP